MDLRSSSPEPAAAPSTEELVGRSRADRPGAFAELYRRVAPAVYTWAALHLHAPLRTLIDPEDVLQEVACRAYEGFESFDAERGDFRGWLFGIARNVLYQAMERLRSSGAPSPARLPDLPDTATSITNRVARDEQLASFVDLINGMADEDRLLLIYRGLEGLPHERVGELMDLSADTVMQRWSRLRARLRQGGLATEFVAA